VELVSHSVSVAGGTRHALAVPIYLAVATVGTDVGMAYKVPLLATVLIKVDALVALAVVFALTAVGVPFCKVGCLILDVALDASVAFAAVGALEAATAPCY
jgi:hypothetical protein